MKALILILLIVLAVILFAFFGPAKQQPAAKPAQTGVTAPAAVPTQPRPATAVAPAPQQPSPRQSGGLSAPAQATGVTTETVDVGGGGAVFEAKRRMTDKLEHVSPSGKKR